ncbi:MAG: hypothetical protein V3U84_08320 [Thiotrichaceae bacterium]
MSPHSWTIRKVTGWSRWYCNSNLNGFALLLIICAALNTAFSAPRTPTHDDEVLERLSTSTLSNPAKSSNQANNNSSQGNSQVKKLRKQLNLAPNNITLASQLATRYIRIARINSDSRYYGYAKAVLKPWWKQQDAPTEVLFLRATLRQHKHKYTQATQDLKQLLKRQPKHTQGWLTLATIQQLQGKYSSARASCSALARTSSSLSTWLSSLCHSQVLSYTGSAERAYQLQQVLTLQVNAKQHELMQWTLGLSAETATRIGNLEQAENHYKTALALPLRDAYLLRSYSDFLIAENRPAEVLILLENETKDDALLLRLAIAAKQANEDELAEDYQALLQTRYKTAYLLGSKLHDRDKALYLLEFGGNPKKALKLAEDNWNIQREPDDALILLRAAMINKSDSSIAKIRDWIDQHKLQDIRLEKLLNHYQRAA